jgi:hypothetical protein
VKSSTRVTDAQGYSGVAVPRSGHYVAVGEGKAGLGTTAVTVN